MVAEDRKTAGLFKEQSVKTNATVAILKKLKGKLFIDNKKENKIALEYVKKLNIKTPSIQHFVRNLSGGNQQKVIIARWLMTEPKIMLLDEPTHGIDVGAKAEIYRLMRELTCQGVSILLISSELSEIMLMSDRIIVMRDGEICGVMRREEVDEESIMKYATGQMKMKLGGTYEF